MTLAWCKSSHSSHTNCVEVAFPANAAAMRDSKNPAAPTLAIPRHALTHLLRSLGER